MDFSQEPKKKAVFDQESFKFYQSVCNKIHMYIFIYILHTILVCNIIPLKGTNMDV
jgi:type IV secretory pathway VirB4 component